MPAALPQQKLNLTACPCCKRLFPFPSDAIKLSGNVRRRYFDALAKAPDGLTREQILNAVYADDPNGGPDAYETVRQHIFEINKTLAKHGLKIKSPLGGPGARYYLVQL
jgi:hypothetical protein